MGNKYADRTHDPLVRVTPEPDPPSTAHPNYPPFFDDETGFNIELPEHNNMWFAPPEKSTPDRADTIRFTLHDAYTLTFLYHGATRIVLPLSVRFGISPRYPEPCWFMRGYEQNIHGAVEFVMRDIHDVRKS
jgi:hypothetical protein